jgi:hypothetical protein
LSTAFKILSNILPSNLSPYSEKVLWDNQCGFLCYRSTNDYMFCSHPILLNKWEYNEAVYQLLIDFKKTYNSIRTGVLYNILNECIPVKLVSLIKMCLNETYNRVQVSKHLSDMFPITNGVKQGDPLLPLFFNFALQHAIRRI